MSELNPEVFECYHLFDINDNNISIGTFIVHEVFEIKENTYPNKVTNHIRLRNVKDESLHDFVFVLSENSFISGWRLLFEDPQKGEQMCYSLNGPVYSLSSCV